MKRLGKILLMLVPAALVAAIVYAAQGWQDDQDGQNFSLSNVSTVQINNGVSGITQCAEFAPNGTLAGTGAPCAVGVGGSSGAVNSVTGTAQRISASPTTGAVVVDTIGGFYSGITSGGNEDLGGNASGVVQQTTTAGVAALSTYQCAANEIQYGAASLGALAQASTFVFNGSKLSIGQSTFDATDHTVLTDDTTTNTIAAWDSRHVAFGIAGALGAGIGFSHTAGTSTGIVSFVSPNVAWENARLQAQTFGLYSAGATLGLKQDGSGNVYDSVLTSNGLLKTTSSSGLHAIATAGTDYMLGPLTGDVTTPSAGSSVTTLVNIPNDVTMAGDLLATTITAPGTPSAGKVRIYADSTFNILNAKNSSGSISHTVVNTTCSTSQWANAMTAPGLMLCTQPGFSDLSGTLTCGQSEGPWTGDVSKAANSCATALVNIPNDVAQAGDILVTNSAAPSTPAAGKTRCYVDSTSKNGACKNDAGTVNHGIQTVSCGGNQWVNAISDAGGSACVQPAFSNLSGSVSCGQLPALTGAVTSSAGSCATVLASLAGKTPQTMFWAWNLPTSLALSNRFLCEGNYDNGTATCNQYPVLQSFTHVTMSLNITTNTCTGGGSPSFSVNLLKNGSGLVNLPVACGTTGIVTTGSVAFAAAAGDVIGLVYDGTLFGTGIGGGTSAFVTTRFDP